MVTDEEVTPAASLSRTHSNLEPGNEPRKLKRSACRVWSNRHMSCLSQSTCALPSILAETLRTVDSAESAIQSGNSSTDTDTDTNTNTNTETDNDDSDEEDTGLTKVTGFSQRVMSEVHLIFKYQYCYSRQLRDLLGLARIS